jgi:hypothetical protein
LTICAPEQNFAGKYFRFFDLEFHSKNFGKNHLKPDLQKNHLENLQRFKCPGINCLLSGAKSAG